DGLDLRHDEGASAETEGDDDDDRRRADDEPRQREPRLHRVRAEAVQCGGENFAADHASSFASYNFRAPTCEPGAVLTASPSCSAVALGRITTSPSCKPP